MLRERAPAKEAEGLIAADSGVCVDPTEAELVGTRGEIEDLVARAGTGFAGRIVIEPVGAPVAAQRVGARASDDEVGPCASVNGVVAAAALDRGDPRQGGVGEIERVGGRASGDGHRRKAVRGNELDIRHARQADLGALRTGFDAVGACTAVDAVEPFAGTRKADQIVARSGRDGVVSSAARDRVVAATRLDRVVAGLAADDPGVVGGGLQHVVAGRSGQGPRRVREGRGRAIEHDFDKPAIRGLIEAVIGDPETELSRSVARRPKLEAFRIDSQPVCVRILRQDVDRLDDLAGAIEHVDVGAETAGDVEQIARGIVGQTLRSGIRRVGIGNRSEPARQLDLRDESAGLSHFVDAPVVLAQNEQMAVGRIDADVLRVLAAEARGREGADHDARIVRVDLEHALPVVVGDEQVGFAGGIDPGRDARRFPGEARQADAAQPTGLAVQPEHVDGTEERPLVDFRVDHEIAAGRRIERDDRKGASPEAATAGAAAVRRTRIDDHAANAGLSGESRSLDARGTCGGIGSPCRSQRF